MKLSSYETLLASLPIIFVLVALIGAILFFPQINSDTRGKAAEVTPAIVKVTIPPTAVTPVVTATPISETACSELYSPVCSDSGTTYSSECEAGKMNATIAYFGECK